MENIDNQSCTRMNGGGQNAAAPVIYVHNDQVISNLFEYKELLVPLANNQLGIKMQIRRVDPNGPNPIVARNESGIFPVGWDIVKSLNPFYMACMNCNAEGIEEIGQVKIEKNIISNTTNLCHLPQGTPPWNNSYTFQALVAYKMDSPLLSPNGDRVGNSDTLEQSVRAQTPFKDALAIFDLEQFAGENETTATLINTNGQILVRQNIKASSGPISMPCNSIPPGMYFLKLESNGAVQILKVLKSE